MVIKALEAPLRQIVTNAGKDEGSVIVDKVRTSLKENAGYDALNDVFVDDMIKAGIIDPVKVTRALQNASSAAAILLTTEAAIADEPKEEVAEPQGSWRGYGILETL